jgi:hypothetical protein
MKFKDFSFGSLQIDNTVYDHDVVIDRGKSHMRKKKVSKQFKDEFGHAPLSAKEDIPWKCRRLVVGTSAYGRLPIMNEVQREAERRKVKLLTMPTKAALETLNEGLVELFP